MSSSSNPASNPGLVAGHAEYIKGAAESTIGAVTGSNAWQKSGEQAKAHAVDAMKQASADRDPASSGYGKAEEIAGRVTGCEGMKEEGAASAAAKQQ
ncbi:uncharacterized protein LTHEOB_9173 [Neofusicoccum parvum]|uniref:Uncharacterized protein LTHEOB_9173 n=1 Tax=Neofusicoccum parvum TaxID=310453 RepID=A0ACB5RRL0_9PEZI|nr:uncharacterized protein LTHEOB_9173 [Neofusicoccum parvum]